MAHGSRKAVVTALFANTVLTVLKFIAAVFSHSASMMNEAIHSLMDSLNQAFLLLGLNVARRPADADYAFGHGQKKYLWNLWSAIGLFSIGCGLGLAHAWHSLELLAHKQPREVIEFLGVSVSPLWIVATVLLVALLLDGYSLGVALQEFRKRMRQSGDSNYIRALVRSDDPTLVAVVLEDTVATLGVLLAMTGIALATFTGNPVWDIAFSAMIALLLGLTAFFLGAVNMRFLADVRDKSAEAAFVRVVAEHREVERYHDLRSIIIDDQHTVLVAEIELREEAIVAGLQSAIDAYESEYLEMLSGEKRRDEKIQAYCHTRAAAQATLEKTETVIEELAAAVKLQARQVHHVTIEVEGIATPPAGA
jgi:cation diffusion facilitator family transporter